MGNDQSTTDQEYQPTKLKILLERVRNVPMYTSADGNRKAEVFIELSLGGVAFTTHRVFASLTGEVILKKKFSFFLKAPPRSPLTLKVIDYKLGEIGRKELTWGAIPHYRKWDLYTPSYHWTFTPARDTISKLNSEATENVFVNPAPCKLEFKAIISRRKCIRPKVSVVVCPCIRITSSSEAQSVKENFPLVDERIRRWTVLNCNLKELETATRAVVHKWSVVANQNNVILGDIYDLYDPHDRRHANRQAFLRRHSQSVVAPGPPLTKKADANISQLDITVIGNLSMPDPNEVGTSISGPEVHPVVESAEQRFISQQRSFSTVIRLADVGEHADLKTLFLWRSLPNILMATDTKDTILSDLLNKTTNYYYNPSDWPLISHVHPHRVLCSGGETVTVTGRHFGLYHTQLAKLLVCGVDCTDTLQYISTSKFRFVTKPCIPCCGEVKLWTSAGQISASKATIWFYDPLMEVTSTEETASLRKSRKQISSLERLKQYEATLEEEIVTVIKSVVHNELYNDALKSYLADLEQRAAANHPDIFHEYRVDVDDLLHHHHHSLAYHRLH